MSGKFLTSPGGLVFLVVDENTLLPWQRPDGSLFVEQAELPLDRAQVDYGPLIECDTYGYVIFNDTYWETLYDCE